MPDHRGSPEYEELIRASHSTLQWSLLFEKSSSLTPVERQANTSLRAYVRAAIRDGSTHQLSLNELRRRQRKIDRLQWALLNNYMRRKLKK